MADLYQIVVWADRQALWPHDVTLVLMDSRPFVG